MKILIAEDEPLTAFVLKRELEDAGHEVVGPATGMLEALRLAAQSRPDLALLEIELEGEYTGIELARRLVRDGIACVFTTAQSKLAHANAAWAVGYVAKPYHSDEIAKIVSAIADVLIGAPPGGRASSSSVEFFGAQP